MLVSYLEESGHAFTLIRVGYCPTDFRTLPDPEGLDSIVAVEKTSERDGC